MRQGKNNEKEEIFGGTISLTKFRIRVFRLNDDVENLAIKLGLPTIRFHDLRHTHVTMLIKQNVNVKVISERVGHTSIQITLDKCSHVLPSMQKHVADELDNLFKIKEM
ncbi:MULTISPECIES: tyrosine-type recombinase/integrase [Peribacillus]|uniref:tyrosine-type recombinase/integrase n=1 Tax=Peribacillus frigoritolerans TaxID=450367 RepID=UPI003DA1690D